MNTVNLENCLIMIIDVQEKLVNMLDDKTVGINAEKIAKAAGILNIPTLITEQYPKGLGTTLNAIKYSLSNAKYIEKTNFSALKEEGLVNLIKSFNKKQIVLFGIETHICVLQTAFDLINKGYEIYVVEDASGSRKESDKISALKRLRHNNCQIITTEMLIFELLGSSKHKNFKEIQALIK